MEEVTLRGLLRKIDSLHSDILSYKTQSDQLKSEVASIKERDLLSTFDQRCQEYIDKCDQMCESLKESNVDSAKRLVESMNEVRQQMVKDVADIDKEYSQKNVIMYNTIQSLIKRLDRVHIDIINNDDNITITYTDHNGNTEYGSILKVRADNNTLIQDHNGLLSVKHKFDDKSFVVKDDVVYPTQLMTKQGKYVSSEYIENDLRNATYCIESLTRKLENLQKQLSTVNGYVASNNFKVGSVSQDKLTQFAIECMSNSSKSVSAEEIPVGTKIKNTFDDHIWVYNRNSITKETKWEDFGSDSICIANNDGIHGLVVGSNDKFKGHIDLHGMISINGLQEEVDNILESLYSFGNVMDSYESRLDKVEQMLGISKKQQ